SVGGDVFALVYDARSREVSVYNGSGAAPAALDPAPFAAGFPDAGASIATVPGAPAAWADLAREHGRFGLDRLLAPAIQYAGQGFPVSDGLAYSFADTGARFDADSARVFGPRGRFPKAGDILQQPDLAATLRVVARTNAAGFYEGDFAERFAAAIGRA